MKDLKTNGSYIPIFFFPCFFSYWFGFSMGWNELNISILPKNTMLAISLVIVLETETKDLDIHLHALEIFKPNLQWP